MASLKHLLEIIVWLVALVEYKLSLDKMEGWSRLIPEELSETLGQSLQLDKR